MLGTILLAVAACAADPSDTALAGASAPTAVVVCPAAFQPALGPWIEHRQRQGHRFAFVDNCQTAENIRDAIRAHAAAGNLKFLVLVGDAASLTDQTVAERALSIPTHFQPAKVNIHWGSEPILATDNWYADLDDDQIPDLAVGRLTADSSAELEVMVRKILQYEQRPAGNWWHRVNLIAGVGGFSPVIDNLLESATKHFVTAGIPSAYQTSVTYASWRSPYCPDPRRFRDAAIERLNEGCLFWVYIGHGQKDHLDMVHVPGARYPILGQQDVDKLENMQGSAIAVFLACYTGAFDQPTDCLAEQLLKSPGGPVAVYSGTRVTMPYAMAVMSTEMMKAHFVDGRATLGEVILQAKQRMAAAQGGGRFSLDLNRRMLDALARAISPDPELMDAERLEHIALFNLLGDPMLALHHPQPFPIELEPLAQAGDQLEVSGQFPFAGQCTIELVCRRDRSRFVLSPRTEFDASDGALSAYNEAYRQANDHRWTVAQFAASAGPFQWKLPIPDDAHGACHVRVVVAGSDGIALAARDIEVAK